MAVLSVAQVKTRVDDALSKAGFKRSGYPNELFGYDTAKLVPKSYSVGTPSTTIDAFDGRENYGEQGEAQTSVVVQTASRLRGDNMASDYDAGLDHEHAVIKAVLALDDTYLDVRVLGATRQVADTGEWLISAVTFRVWHRFSFVDGV